MEHTDDGQCRLTLLAKDVRYRQGDRRRMRRFIVTLDDLDPCKTTVGSHKQRELWAYDICAHLVRVHGRDPGWDDKERWLLDACVRLLTR